MKPALHGWSRIAATALLGAAAVAVVIGALRLAPDPALDGPRGEDGAPMTAAERRGALVDEVVFAVESDLGRMTELVKSGSHQLFGVGISNPTVFRAIRNDPDFVYEISYGTSAELTLNPVGPRFDDGRINPFHDREIREALNWLIDRRYIAEEIYGGLAVPRYLPLSTAFPDYARLAETARALELAYEHDPERARRVIHERLQALGASVQGGRILQDGRPLGLSVLIRIDDERRRVGDYVANLLEDLGFVVERMYREPDEAARIWASGDPAAGRWHIYTGAWAANYISRDQAINFTQYYTPHGRPEPLWQAYEPAPEFEELAVRLQQRDYTTWAQRQEMMARATELAMRDSARIWLVDQINAWPRAATLDVAVDLAAGVSGSFLWPYTLRYRDRLGGRVVFGLPDVLTEPWNPVAGTTWIFDQMILRGLTDPVVIPDPFTGLIRPQRIERAQVTVQEDVPVINTLDWVTLDHAPEIAVPEDAWVDWSHQEQRFVPAGEAHPEGLSARTRVVVHYEEGFLERRWHDGSQVSMADLILPWILTFERADESSPLYDPAEVPAFEVFRGHFRGWRIVSQDPLVVEIYSDQIYPDADFIVANRAPALLPWHTVNLGVLAEHAGELAFSSGKADRERVDWMSLVAGPSLGILDRHLQRMTAGASFPHAAALAPYLRDGEVEERHAALARWREERRHFWVGDGPFYLRSVHPVERTVVLARYEDFPDPADKWLGLTQPRIPVVELDGPMVVETGGAAHFDLTVHFEAQPYPEESLERASYMVFDRRGALVLEGEAVPQGEGLWRIELAADELSVLGPGASSLEVAVISHEVALPTFASHVFAVAGGETAREP